MAPWLQGGPGKVARVPPWERRSHVQDVTRTRGGGGGGCCSVVGAADGLRRLQCPVRRVGGELVTESQPGEAWDRPASSTAARVGALLPPVRSGAEGSPSPAAPVRPHRSCPPPPPALPPAGLAPPSLCAPPSQGCWHRHGSLGLPENTRSATLVPCQSLRDPPALQLAPWGPGLTPRLEGGEDSPLVSRASRPLGVPGTARGGLRPPPRGGEARRSGSRP